MAVNEVRALYHAEHQLRLSRLKRRPPSLPRTLGPLLITPEAPAPSEPAPEPEPPAPAPPPGPASEGDRLRAALSRKRKDIGEPDTLTFGAEDRRRPKESKSDG